MRLWFSLIVLTAFSLGNMVCAEDVVRFRGENSQGIFNETGLLKTWPEGGPERLWVNEELADGWSSITKVKDRIYVNCLYSAESKKESIVCLDLNGKKLWQQPTGPIWAGDHPSPRSTPTYVAGDKADDDRLLTLSGAGELYCLAAKDGAVIWRKYLTDIYQTKFGNWGIAESVIVKDGVVFVTVCGEKALAVALKLADGEVVWESPATEDTCNYVTPVIWNNLLIIMTSHHVTGLDIASGKSMWKEDYQAIVGPSRLPGVNCVTPLLKDNRFFVTSGFGQGGVMFEILPDNKGLKQLWTNKDLDTYYGGVVELNGRIYGASFRGSWINLDWNTGETVYNESWENLAKGAIISADDMLYLYEEKRGTVGLVKPGDQFEIVGSFEIGVGSREHWAHPAISDGVLYVRHGSALAAYDIRKK